MAKPTTVTELWKRLEEEWTKITPEQCEKLVMYCSHRRVEVIERKGPYTFYKFLTAVTLKNFSCKLFPVLQWFLFSNSDLGYFVKHASRTVVYPQLIFLQILSDED